MRCPPGKRPKFLLKRNSYWVERHGHMVTRMPEPEETKKRAPVSNVAELVAEAEKFASEYGGACEVYMKCLTERPFAKCPGVSAVIRTGPLRRRSERTRPRGATRRPDIDP